MSPRTQCRIFFAFVLFLGCWAVSTAQVPAARIAGTINGSSRVTMAGSHPVAARATNDEGRVPVSSELKGISFVFSRTATQEATLQALLVAQQDPASSLYHQWLTPEQFAARFGMADSDLAKVQGWLEQQGFTVEGVARSRNRISFSGSVAQVEAAFGTEMHFYRSGDETHFAPASDLTLPAAVAATVQGVTNLSDFRPKPRVKMRQGVQADFTSSQSGSHFLTPKDLATIYDINAAYTAGYTGIGQSIAIVGQSAVVTADITNFQTAAGLTTKVPTLVLMPGTGTSTIYTGDEAESDLDLEYSGGIAKGANIFFVYTGSSTNYGVFDALGYAVTERIAPIISVSYGSCELNLGTQYTTYNAYLAQAASQGQTVVAASGDSGSTDCYSNTNLTTAQRMSLAVDFPAVSQYVTGLGGTEFLSSAVSSTNTTYWTASTGTDVISSALSYIPEMVWNDDSSSNTTNPLSSGGGGTSTLTARPTWQTGVTGITSGSFRLVPDISLASSPSNAGYLYCSSDTSTGITGSCANGFRNSANTSLTVAGGTSFAAPIFAGMLALINQSRNSTGQGLINPTLYSLAGNSTTYASAFHDITSGSNACTAGTTYCSAVGAASYSATTGYDQASGLGSVDLFNLLQAWPKTAASSLASSTVTLSAATASPVPGASDVVTITVASGASLLTTIPTGTLTVLVDGVTVTSTLAVSGGMASYPFSSSTAGAHIVTVTYSGDSVYAGSMSAISLTVGAAATSSGTFTISATSVTVASGSSGASTVTVTPSGGYTGTIAWTVRSSTTLANACYTISSLTVTGTTPVTTALTFSTSSSTCSNSSATGGSGRVKLTNLPLAFTGGGQSPGSSPYPLGPGAIAAAGLLTVGLIKRRTRAGWSLLSVAILGILGVTLSGCSSSVSTATTTSKGTYTITLVGTDTSSSAIAASTSLTLTIN